MYVKHVVSFHVCLSQDNRTPGWCLSETYLKFGMNAREDNVWIPDDTYYCKLIGRLVDNILIILIQLKGGSITVLSNSVALFLANAKDMGLWGKLSNIFTSLPIPLVSLNAS